MNLDEEMAFDEAKKVFKISEDREANLNNEKDLLVISALQIGIQHGFKMGYDKYYTPLCDKCNFNRATCFGPGAYCDDCAMDIDEEE